MCCSCRNLVSVSITSLRSTSAILFKKNTIYYYKIIIAKAQLMGEKEKEGREEKRMKEC